MRSKERSSVKSCRVLDGHVTEKEFESIMPNIHEASFEMTRILAPYYK
jgi:hypothetical protein